MKKTENILQMDIEKSEMPTALKNALQVNGIMKVSQILGMNEHEVKMLKNFGSKRIEMLNKFLSENNLKLKAF